MDRKALSIPLIGSFRHILVSRKTTNKCHSLLLEYRLIRHILDDYDDGQVVISSVWTRTLSEVMKHTRNHVVFIIRTIFIEKSLIRSEFSWYHQRQERRISARWIMEKMIDIFFGDKNGWIHTVNSILKSCADKFTVSVEPHVVDTQMQIHYVSYK